MKSAYSNTFQPFSNLEVSEVQLFQPFQPFLPLDNTGTRIDEHTEENLREVFQVGGGSWKVGIPAL